MRTLFYIYLDSCFFYVMMLLKRSYKIDNTKSLLCFLDDKYLCVVLNMYAVKNGTTSVCVAAFLHPLNSRRFFSAVPKGATVLILFIISKLFRSYLICF